MAEKIRISAIIVTHNRLELLKKCVESVRNQTHKVDEIIVVNNSSTDGTAEWLNEQIDLTVITQENSGSAGGQYSGIKTAYEKEYNWIWCLDTDVVPEANALEMLLDNKQIKEKNIGFISSTIYSPDGNLAHANIPELAEPYEVLNTIVRTDFIPILTASFGSILIRREAVREIGFPSMDFFIWGDDAEYTYRMISKNYSGFMSLKSKAIHYQENKKFPFSNLKVNDIKLSYGLRNMVYVNILRNKIVYKSIFRGWLSGLAFIIRVYRQRKANAEFSFLKEISILVRGFFKGILFKPKIENPFK